MSSDDRIEQLVKAILQAVDARLEPLRGEISELRAEVARLGGTAPAPAPELDVDLLARLFDDKLHALVGTLG